MHDSQPEQLSAEPQSRDQGSLVPTLTKETWELIELRLWNAFSKKLWVILTSVLTIAAIAALLGVDAWVKSKVSDTLKIEVAHFEKARKDYDAKTQRQLIATTALVALQERFLSDSGKYAIAANRLAEALNDEQRKSMVLFRPLSILFNPYSIPRVNPEQFTQDFAKLQKEYPELVQESAIGLLGISGAIKNQYRDYWHLQGLLAAIQLARADLLTAGEFDSNALAKYYESKLYPGYIATLTQQGLSPGWAMGWSHIGLLSINSLKQHANAEYMLLAPEKSASQPR